jgi:predicted acetyltransferase
VSEGWVVRPASEADFERMCEIHSFSYPGSGSHEQQKREVIRDGFGGGFAARRVVERDGRIVGGGAIYALEMWLGGKKVQVGGVASLAIAPEARRQGVARSLLRSMHGEMQTNGAALSLLYPFEQGFYAKLGYGVTAPLFTLRVATKQLLGLEVPSSGFVASPVEGPAARALYDDVGPQASGRLVRSEARWIELFANEQRYWMGVEHTGRLQGYVSFAHESRGGEVALVVHELIARDAAAKRALFAALGRQCDQFVAAELSLPFDDAWSVGLHGAKGKLDRGPMVKLIDVRRAFASRGYHAEGTLTWLLTDDPTAKPLRVAIRSGSIDLTETNRPADVELSAATLASILASGMRPSEAAEMGLLRADADALRTADAIFAAPRFHCLDPF